MSVLCASKAIADMRLNLTSTKQFQKKASSWSKFTVSPFRNIYTVSILSKTTEVRKLTPRLTYAKHIKLSVKQTPIATQFQTAKYFLKKGTSINTSLLDTFSISTLKLHLEQEV